MDVARTLAEIGGNVPLYLLAVNEMPLAVDFEDAPDVPCDGDFLPDGRRRNDRADLLRFAASCARRRAIPIS